MSESNVAIPQSDVKQQSNDVARICASLETEVTEYNRMFCYIRTLNLIARLSDFEMFQPGPFIKQQYGNWMYEYQTDGGDKKYGRLAAKWFQRTDRHQLDGMTYAPGKGPVVGNALNRWRGFGSHPAQGDIGPWNELLDYLFPNAPAARRYFEQWLAYPIQHPGTKLKTAVVLHSRIQGIGKSILTEAIARIYGGNAQVIGETQLYENFNWWQRDKQFIVGEEIQGGKDKRAVVERLKLLITAQEVTVNEKYRPQFSIPNVANFVFLSNNPDPFYIADQDRRFWIWEIPQDTKLPDAFYNDFRNWKESSAGIAALHYRLQHLDLMGFNPDAAAPSTQSKEEMIELNWSELERWIRDLVASSSTQLFTMEELLALYRAERSELNPKEGHAAMTKALKKAGFKLAYAGKQLKIGRVPRTLWVIGDPATPEAKRLLSLADPFVLAAEHKAQHGLFGPVTTPKAVTAPENTVTELKVN